MFLIITNKQKDSLNHLFYVHLNFTTTLFIKLFQGYPQFYRFRFRLFFTTFGHSSNNL